ncbi:coiled-coil domain-containing protein 17 [Sminthopsis crassicaudata]|uniref:coiled-coil domain-containing protein 17 n=1 Tax=Sminthopsis crassicaudata TaxID=9301 RepID=UPI003D68F06A
MPRPCLVTGPTQGQPSLGPAASPGHSVPGSHGSLPSFCPILPAWASREPGSPSPSVSVRAGMASGPEEPGRPGAPASFPCSACDMVFPSRMLRDSHAHRFCIGHLTPGLPEGPRESRAPRRKVQSQQPEDPVETHKRALDQGETSGDTLKRLTDEVQRLRVSLQAMASPQKGAAGSRAHLEALHARRLAEIGARTRRLEKHREEIRQQLGEVAGGNAGPGVLGQVMLAIQAQETRTQQALDSLGERVDKLQARTQPDLPVGKEGGGPLLGPLALPASQGVLASEIRALQTSYLQAGGRDPGVLTQIWELHLEAALLEGRTGQKQGKVAAGRRAPDTQLQALEAINRHLETEILALQAQRGPRRARQGFLHVPRGPGPGQIPDSPRIGLGGGGAACLHNLSLAASVGPVSPRRTRPRCLGTSRPIRAPGAVARRMPGADSGPWDPAFLPSGPREPQEGLGLLRRGRGGSARLPPPVAPPLPPPAPGLPGDPPMPGLMESPGGPGQSRQLLPPPEVLGPAPYDPGAGFAIFYDFLLGLEPAWSQVQLVAALARAGQESGAGTALPSRPCLPLPPTPGAPLGHCAVLAARQPVPRLPPSPAVTLVTELQAWGLWDGGREPRPQAWTSLPLFDREHRVLSGRWRLPLRVLPRAPGLDPRQLNAIPQAGHTELYLRIANARDAEIQALARIDPTQSREYRYLPTVSHSASVEDYLHPHFLGPPSLLPSLSLPDGFNDPPPAPE